MTSWRLCRAVNASRVNGVSVEGIAPMGFLRFDDAHRESRFLELARKKACSSSGELQLCFTTHDDTLPAIEGAASAGSSLFAEEAK